MINLTTVKDKRLKGLSPHISISQMSFSIFAHGFWIASQSDCKYFPMPDLREIEKNNLKVYRTM